MTDNHSACFRQGVRNGIPISLGYIAVSFTLGIAARNTGLTAFQATIMSLTNNTSAGEFAALGLMSAGASFGEMAFTQLIINLRYLLMSCALSQKLDPGVSLSKRFLMGYAITDEVFGVSVSVPGKLNPYFTYGAIAAAAPGWALGTCLGVVMGNVLPERMVSALSVALYGMFLAVILPPARKNRILAGVIVLSMGASFLFSRIPALRMVSSGMRIIVLTVVIAGAAAVLFPVKEPDSSHESATNSQEDLTQ